MYRDLLLFYRSVVVLFLMVLTLDATAQDYRAHNWYFGNTGHGIRFNRTDHSASLVTNGVTTTPGGTAVATDPANGNLLFYTDGQNIYDASHQVMDGSPGAGLGANPNGNQPVAIAAVPGQVKQYYVFINTASETTGGTVSYWIVDLTLPGNAGISSPPLGRVTTGPTNVAIPGLVSEAMITIPHADGENFYLLTHASGSAAIHVTSFTSAPASTTTHTPAGLIEHASNFSWYDAGNGNGRLAVSPHETQRAVELFQFNTTNGALTPAAQLPNTAVTTAVTGAAIYDTEWSNSGRYLYVSRNRGGQGDILQVDVTNALATPQNILPQSIAASFGLQMAPDSMIYHLYQQTAGGSFLVGRIGSPDTVAVGVNYTSDPFGTIDFGATQFSSFSPMDTVQLSVTFEAEDGCTNTPVAFFPTVTPAADSLVWDFGDGNGGFGWSPVHTYEGAGAFPVTVTAFLRGNTASFTGNINITQFDLQLTLVQDTTACACELPVHNGKPMANGEICADDASDDMAVTVTAEGGTPMYQWFGPGGILAGQTNEPETLRPDSAGYYYVIATVGGCSAYAGVNIKEYDSLNQQMNIWHFGGGAGIDFNPLPDNPPVGIAGPLNAPEGTSVICDQNGQIVLSTDGQRVYKRGANNEMVDITPNPNPPGLGGDPGATQSALIVPVPGDETLYYIFTTQATDGPTGAHQLKYSLYDIKLNNGEGDFVVFNQVLFARSTERITSNGNWLIAHEFGNNSFRAYRISAQGIGNPVVTAIGSDHTTTVLQHGQGYMELGGENRLAVALSTPGISNVVEVFDFVDSTGMVINFRQADLNAPNGQVYGIELFGDKLYVSLMDTDSKIYEFAFDDEGNLTLLQDRTYPGEMIGAMQIGPDGMVYVARNGSSSLWTFPPVSDVSQQTALDPLQEFALFSGTTSTLGLPNFTQIISSPTQEPAFTWSGACLGDSTIFSASGKDSAIDEFTWSILDSNNQAIPIPSDNQGGPELAVLFDAPGTYMVSVVITNKCETNYQTFTEQITINPSPPDPSEGLTFCADPLQLDANPDDIPDFTYAWSTGETTETIEITAVTPPATVVSVVVTDAQGCTTTGEFLIADNRPLVELGQDLTICQHTPFADLNANNPNATHTWFFQENPNGNTTPTQAVDTSTPGTFEYKVEVIDPVTTCRVRDSVVVTINESPSWTATPVNPPACNTATGQIDLVIDAPDGSLFSWTVTGPVAESGIDQVSDVPFSTQPILSAGAYAVTVTDQVSSCATTATVNIDDPAFNVTAIQDGTCEPNIAIQVTTGVTDPVQYRVIDDATGDVVIILTNETDGDFLTDFLPSGSSYVVEVRQTSTNCVASSTPLQLDQGPALTVSFDNGDVCDDNTLTAVAAGGSGNYTFDWSDSPGGSVDPDIGPDVTVSPGTWTLTVTATDNGGTMCPGTASTTLTVEPPLTPDFTQSNACAPSVILSASPTGNFTYRWYRDGFAIPGGGGQQIVAGVQDDQLEYRVEIVSTLSGCVFSSAERPVNVAGVVNVLLTSTTACEGREFTLTATPTPASITTFTWTLNGNSLPTTTTQHQDNREGRYLVSFTHSGCMVTDDVFIDPLPVTPGILLDSYVICPDDPRDDAPNKTVTLDAGEGLLSYQWYVNGQPEPGATNRLFVAEDVGTYRVEMMNIFGCESADETDLFEGCDPLITGPNAFRPSGINTAFSLFTFFIADEDFHIFIFNRWGEMVFQSDQRTFAWNGGYNNNPGQPLPPGTYSYVVKYRSIYDNQIRETRGGVVLLR